MKIEHLKSKLNLDIYQKLSNFLLRTPEKILCKLQEVSIEKGVTLMKSDEIVRDVYILLVGSMDAIEEKTPNYPYTFIEITPFDIIGDHEIFSNHDRRFATIITNQECLCLKLDASDFLEWMKVDQHALFIRTQVFMDVMSSQIQFHRQFLFMNYEQRVILYLLLECQKQKNVFPISIHYHRERIASYVSCNIRTLNRIILSLQQRHLIKKSSTNIEISKSQHLQLFDIIEANSFNLSSILFHQSR